MLVLGSRVADLVTERWREKKRKGMIEIEREREKSMDKSMGLHSASTVTSQTKTERVNGDLSA